MKRFDLDKFQILPEHILASYTSEPDYDMDRIILLELEYDRFVIVEGGHCSCYGMNEVEWDALEYTGDELRKLVLAPYNNNSRGYRFPFWEQVRVQLLGY